MTMINLLFYICFLTACFACGAKEIIIMPQFAVGDTLRYRATTSLVMYHEKDSLVSTTKLLPTLIVDEKNDKGFIITTSNRLEDFSIECSDPEAGETLESFDKSDILNDVVAAITLRIQLGTDCQPDSILNLDAVKERITDAYINMFAKRQEIDESNREEWEKETIPLLIGTVNMMYTPKHLIEQQFGNLPYFNFIGIPLKSGKIPASMVLPEELQMICPGLTELKMNVRQFKSDMESSLEKSDGLYHIKLSGKKGTAHIDGELLYAAGILTNGFLSFRNESDTEKLISNYMIEIIR